MVEGKLQVDLEALASSAVHVSGQAEDLAIAHLSSDNQLASAQPGWVGSSAAALNVKTELWSETSRQLLNRVGGHAIALHSDRIGFADMEQESAEKLRAVNPGVGGIAGSAGM